MRELIEYEEEIEEKENQNKEENNKEKIQHIII